MNKRVLSDEQVAEIRAEYRKGNCSAATLASRYHVSVRVLYRAVAGIRRPPASDRDPVSWDRGYGNGWQR